MKILITGGGGFSGYCCTDYYVKKGHSVTATYRNNIPNKVINYANYVKQDLADEINIRGTFDAIIHTAAARPGNNNKMTDFVKDNIDSARNIISYARKKEIPTIFYFSTRSVYGQIVTGEVREENDVLNPDEYGQTKRIAEQLFMEAEDLNTIGVRLPGVIGPGAHDIWLVDVVNKILKGIDVEISDFETKNLVYIEDIARFSEVLIHESKSNTFKHKVVNLCCTETINNLEIATIVKKRLHSKSNIISVAPTKGLFRLNTEKAQEMGWNSLKPIEIINGYLDWYCKSNSIGR